MRILLVPAGGISDKNQLAPNDTLPRCLAALEIWKEGNYDYLVVCGGIFLPPTIQTNPAAEIMKKWFIRQRVSADRLMVEGKSLDTFENVKFVLELLAENKIEKPEITVVSQWQHTLRFKRTFKSYGVKIKRHPLHYKVGIKTWLMEWAFILIHLIDPKGAGFFGRLNRKRRNQKARVKDKGFFYFNLINLMNLQTRFNHFSHFTAADRSTGTVVKAGAAAGDEH